MAQNFSPPDAGGWLWGLVIALVAIAVVFRVQMLKRLVTGLAA